MSELKEKLDDSSRGNFEAVVLIELGRIYDLLSILAHQASPEQFEKMTVMHEHGRILGPPPAIRTSEDND